jgi:eukaryotic-like serine/threonine-protein kinase
MSPEPGQPLAHYRIVSKIGEGGMGEVWSATDTRLHRSAAIKALPVSVANDAERLARFRREAQVLAALSHPNIAAVYGLEQTDQGTYLAMELVEGEDLAARIERGPVPVDEAVDMAVQIASALEEAHDKGIVHRDLKPANIKVTSDGKVKVLDFGLAKALDLAAAGAGSFGSGPDAVPSDSPIGLPTMTSPAMTAMGMILGTAAYMAPEQARGKAVDKRADIWAFGVVLLEMLTGRRLFAGETVSDVIAAVLTRDPDLTVLPSNTPPSVRHVLARCLERDPKKRLRDIGDARHELESGAAGAGLSQIGPRALPARSTSRTALLMGATGLAAAALTFALLSLGGSTATPALMVFPVPAPPDTRLAQVALSPDGGSLVFVAESSTGVSHLWLRPLDSRTVRRVEGTDGARDPFWSPDSRFVGYFTESRLWKIEVATGVAQALATVVNTRGGAWNRDGAIVVGGNDLVTVPAGGGSASTALGVDSSSGENAIRYPSFLPDGNHVIFYSRNAKDRALAGLWVVSLDTGVRKHLTAAASSSAVYIEPGYLLYRRDRYLVAHPFDAHRLELTGDPRPVAEDVWHEPGVTALTNISVSATSTVVFRTGGPEVTELAWFDRSGQSAGTAWEARSYVTVGLSPDGKQILAGFPSHGAERHAWLYDIATATARQMTSSGDVAGNLLFSGDAMRGVFGMFGESGLTMTLARLGSGAAPVPLPVTGQNSQPTDWLGSRIVYDTSGRDGRGSDRSLYLYDLESGSSRPLVETPADEMFGVISPDRRWLAYASNESGHWDVYVQGFPEASGRWRITTDGGHQPRWNPRGGELFYLAPDRQMMSVGVRAAASAFQWDTPRPLFQTDIVDLGPYRGSWGYAVAPDGNRFLILTRKPQGPGPAVVIVNWR